MTTARQKRNRFRLVAGAGFAAYAALVFGLPTAPPTSRALAGERIVVDWHSGLAIDGYDPVAFFTEGKPVAGSADFELRYVNVIWRFSNPGNRAAFAAAPDVYMPQYGGYDPLGVARGLAVAGNRKPARHAQGIVAAILRHVDIGCRGKGGAIARVGKSPNNIDIAQFEVGAAGNRLALGEEGHGIIAVNRKPAVPIDHNSFAGQCSRGRRSRGQTKDQRRVGGESGACDQPKAVSFLPCCGHSPGKGCSDSFDSRP